MIRFFLCLVFVCISFSSIAQISPADGDTLNYIHVLFDMPVNTAAAGYHLMVSTDKEFSKHNITVDIKENTSQFVVKQGLEFGKHYYWKYDCVSGKGENMFSSPVYSFDIIGNRLADTAYYKNVIITKMNAPIEDGYIAADEGFIMDRNGKVIWTFPPSFEYKGLRNIQLNKDGNITFTDTKLDYEIDLKNRLLWQSPIVLHRDSSSKIAMRSYHHDICKLDNGNFLCVAEKETGDEDVAVNVVFEVSRDGKLKWIYDEEGLYPREVKTQTNSAMLDKDGRYLYVSNKAIDAIAKIDVKTGNPIYIIGYHGKGVASSKQSFFSKQHALSILEDGTLLLYNNNTEGQRHPGITSIMLLSQPDSINAAKIIWEYEFNFGDSEDNYVGKLGDVAQIEKGNFLIGGGTNSRIFEINKNKEIVWQSIGQYYDSVTRTFIPYMKSDMPYKSGYRIDFITSLFPTRFITYVEESGKSRQLVIKNTGNYPDKYKYSIQGGAVLETKQIAPGESTHIKLAKKKNGSSVKVISAKNTFNKKILPLK